MGDRLAKDVDAIFKAKIEQLPLWRKAMREGGVTFDDFPVLMAETFSALREAVLYIAEQVDDPPRAGET